MNIGSRARPTSAREGADEEQQEDLQGAHPGDLHLRDFQMRDLVGLKDSWWRVSRGVLECGAAAALGTIFTIARDVAPSVHVLLNRKCDVNGWVCRV